MPSSASRSTVIANESWDEGLPLPLNLNGSGQSYQLGFDLVATFSAPLKIGPVFISDVGGILAFNRQPDLPLFNNRLLAAEEACSVFDHPPVWIFKKRPDFNLGAAQLLLNSVDLSRVVIQSPREATRISLK